VDDFILTSPSTTPTGSNICTVNSLLIFVFI